MATMELGAAMLDWLRRDPRAVPQIEVLGRALPIVMRRTASARRMTMRLAPDGSEVRITLPRWGRSGEALEFARSRADWLASQLAALPAPVALVDGASLPFRGIAHVLRHDPARPRRVRADAGELHIGGPHDGLDGRLRRWLEGEARRLMAEDLAHYCARAGQPPARLMLSRATRRWGSCAHDATIRLNWRLVMAPDSVRRSVVAHEVAHLLHMDHTPKFHAALKSLFEGDIDAANHWLKRDGRSLYVPFG